VIKDDNNEDRIFLGFNDAAAAQIQLKDNQGRVHMQLVTTADGEGSAINLWDIGGQMKANLVVDRNGGGITANGRRIP
jgi:hypothetical protein